MASVPDDAHTSTTHPIRVDWVDMRTVPGLVHASGRLGMTFIPGKKDLNSPRRHWRDLATDVHDLAQRHRADVLVLLVEDHELDLLEVPDLAAEVERAGMELIRFPIVDVSVPDDPEAVAALLGTIRGRLDAGQRVLVACRGGLGRTGTVVGCVLRGAGLDGDAAIALTRATRPGTIETWKQESFVQDWMPLPLDGAPRVTEKESTD